MSVENAQTILELVGPADRWGYREPQSFLRQEDGILLLPVKLGEEFGVQLTNKAGHMVAYPAYTGRDGQRISNIFVANTEMNPNKLVSNGGMLELGEEGSDYASTVIDGFMLPGNMQQKFVVVDGDGGFADGDVDGLLFYRRTRPGVLVTHILGGGGDTRSVSPGPRIGAAEVTEDGRQLTGLDYEQDANPNVPIFHAKIVYGEVAAKARSQAA